MRWFVGLAMSALALFAIPALGVTEAVAADTYGAIAFSPSSGADGYSYNFSSRSGAEEKALQECGRGCKVVIWFRNACAALAVGRGNGYGSYYAVDEEDAVEGAINECRKNTSNCGIKRQVCSSN
jgi:hypothetical protein